VIVDGVRDATGVVLYLLGVLAVVAASAAVVAVAAFAAVKAWNGPLARAGWRVKAYGLARRWRQDVSR
jgi:hypothetical protein